MCVLLNQVSRSDLRDLLLQCCGDEAADVRQSALALLGDLAKVRSGMIATAFLPNIIMLYPSSR